MRSSGSMLLEYVSEAMARARFEKIEDTEPFYGEIAECAGVWATGKTLEECKTKLQDVLEGWLLVRIKMGKPIPQVGGRSISPVVRIEDEAQANQVA